MHSQGSCVLGDGHIRFPKGIHTRRRNRKAIAILPRKANSSGLPVNLDGHDLSRSVLLTSPSTGRFVRLRRCILAQKPRGRWEIIWRRLLPPFLRATRVWDQSAFCVCSGVREASHFVAKNAHRTPKQVSRECCAARFGPRWCHLLLSELDTNWSDESQSPGSRPHSEFSASLFVT